MVVVVVVNQGLDYQANYNSQEKEQIEFGLNIRQTRLADARGQ